jgi:hypothetical protein
MWYKGFPKVTIMPMWLKWLKPRETGHAQGD